MKNATHSLDRQMDDSQDIPYDLSYDDMDTFARCCGVSLPDTGVEGIEPGLRSTPFI